MELYEVDGTHIRFGRDKGDAKTYGPGDEIELTEEEAKALGKSVKLKPRKEPKGNGDPEEKLKALDEAILSLDKDAMGTDGVPNVSVVNGALKKSGHKFTVSAAERDEALERLKAAGKLG